MKKLHGFYDNVLISKFYKLSDTSNTLLQEESIYGSYGIKLDDIVWVRELTADGKIERNLFSHDSVYLSYPQMIMPKRFNRRSYE